MATTSDMGMVFEDRMSDADALMWNIEKDPALRSTIVSVGIFDGELDEERLLERIDRLSRVVPRLRQRVRSNPLSIAPPRWEFDPLFDLRYHVRFARVPGEGGLDDLLELVAPIAMQGFDRARPLWEFTIASGFEGNKSAVIMKVHHAITDGVGGMQIQLELFDLDPDAETRPMPSAPEAHVMSQPQRFADAFEHEVRRGATMASRLGLRALSATFAAIADPGATAESAGELAESVGRLLRPTLAPLSEEMSGRSLSVALGTLTMPLDKSKKAAAKAGGRLNDAFIAAMLLGIDEYHRQRGNPAEKLRMAMPINVRAQSLGNVAGNAFIPARIEIPIDTENPTQLMGEVHNRVLHARDEPANSLVEVLSNSLNRLPTSMVTALMGSMMKGTDFTTSNVPGAPFDVYIDGVRLNAQFAFGPMAGAALNITLISYLNDCNIGVNIDPAAVLDPDLMMRCLQQGIDSVVAEA
jgi:WS/DGAT/MGAT family acyltransferase